MKAGDFLVYTQDGDTAVPPDTYVVQILSIDPNAQFFTCQQIDTGQQFTFQFSSNTSGPWQGEDASGAAYTIDTQTIYTQGYTDPVAPGAALVTFADNTSYLCAVQSISPTIDVVFYQKPYPKLSFDGTNITQSDWDAYPTGGQILSIEGYVETDASVIAASDPGSFINGWWSLARPLNAFAGRIGGPIVPFAVVVHTTDMVPEDWTSLVHSWTTRYGDGACAHFLIGRDATSGFIQFGPITSNGNHAGGTGAGSFVAPGQSWHPNLVSVGIEMHCAGILRQVNGDWRFIDTDTGLPHGLPIPVQDVILDPIRPGVGYHVVTDYQYQQLKLLLNGLEAVLAPLPAGCVAQSIEQPQPYGIFPTGRRVGHVSLDAHDRGDPWPATCDWIRALP